MGRILLQFSPLLEQYPLKQTLLKQARVKICGLTTPEDALQAVACGADAIGLVFYKPSPRYVESETAARIIDAVGPFVTIVGLFVNADADEVRALCDQLDLSLLQFHGDEPEEYCVQFTRPYIKAVRVKPDTDIDAAVAAYPSARGMLFDAWQADKYGGTGKSFNWDLLPRQPEYPLILAGGLTPDNVGEAVQQVSPYAVDVSGGVEVSPGKKSASQVDLFIKHAKFGAKN